MTLTEDDMEQERDAPPGYEAFGAPDLRALAAIPFVPDPSVTNASSIVLLAEFEGRTALLTADANAGALVAALAPLAEASTSRRFVLDALKVPHHGSSHNVSSELVALLDCTTFLLSTNGSYHGHPHDAALARVLTGAPGAHLVFNYRSACTEAWDDDDLRDRYGYTTSYPATTSNGTNVIDLLAGPGPRAEMPQR